MKKLVKKVLASTMALFLVVSILPVSNVSAATTKTPKLSATSLLLAKGATSKLTVSNKVSGSTVKWSSNNTKKVKVSQSGKIRGVGSGITKVVCKVKTPKKTYKLACRVTVVDKSATVTTQKELNQALKSKNLEKLTIKTNDSVKFAIPEADYSNVALVVNAPNADVTNRAVFNSIQIKAIKADTWTEKAIGNKFIITAKAARIVVDAAAQAASLDVNRAGGDVKIEIAGSVGTIAINANANVGLKVDGSVGAVDVKAAATLDVSGETTAAVPVNVNEEANGASVTATTAVDVKADTSISLTLDKGAENSTVQVTNTTSEVTVKNDTAEKIDVSTPEGTKTVETGESGVINSTDTNNGGGGGGAAAGTTGTDDSSSSSTTSTSTTAPTAIEAKDAVTEIVKGEKKTLGVTFTPAGSSGTVTWTASNPDKLSVNSSGQIEAKEVSTNNKITATCNGLTAEWTITVTAATLTSLTLSPTTLSLKAGETATLTPGGAPAAAVPAAGDCTWASSNEEAATVAAGVVTAKAEGTTTITATNGGISATCTVTVAAKDENDVTVTFQNGSNVFVKKTVASGTALSAISVGTPTQSGKTFVGWAASDGGDAVDLSTTKVAVEDPTYYAVFKNTVYPKITFYDGSKVLSTVTNVTDGAVFTLPTNTDKTGYQFKGWSKYSNAAATITSDTTTCDGTLSYYAVYTQLAKLTLSGNAKYEKVDDYLTATGGAVGDDWTSANATYVLPGSGSVEVKFELGDDAIISAIKVDSTSYAADQIATATTGKKITVTKAQHTISITTATKPTLTVATKSGIEMAGSDKNYTVTGASIKISDLLSVSYAPTTLGSRLKVYYIVADGSATSDASTVLTVGDSQSIKVELRLDSTNGTDGTKIAEDSYTFNVKAEATDEEPQGDANLTSTETTAPSRAAKRMSSAPVVAEDETGDTADETVAEDTTESTAADTDVTEEPVISEGEDADTDTAIPAETPAETAPVETEA